MNDGVLYFYDSSCELIFRLCNWAETNFSSRMQKRRRRENRSRQLRFRIVAGRDPRCGSCGTSSFRDLTNSDCTALGAVLSGQEKLNAGTSRPREPDQGGDHHNMIQNAKQDSECGTIEVVNSYSTAL